MNDNPYTPPLADPVADAPRSHGWKTDGGKLFIEPEAILPMVDPYSDETSEHMTLMRIAVPRKVLLPNRLFFGGLCLILLFGFLGFHEAFSLLSVWLLVGLFAGIWNAFFRGSVIVHVFLTRRTVRLQRLIYYSRLHFRKSPDGRREMRGIHPRAMERLLALQSANQPK